MCIHKPKPNLSNHGTFSVLPFLPSIYSQNRRAVWWKDGTATPIRNSFTAHSPLPAIQFPARRCARFRCRYVTLGSGHCMFGGREGGVYIAYSQHVFARRGAVLAHICHMYVACAHGWWVSSAISNVPFALQNAYAPSY